MRVVAVNGSARRDGNTAILINLVCEELHAAGIETELIQLGGQPLHGCTACYKCFERHDGRCSISSDRFNEILAKLVAADGMILGSPVYVSDVTPELKALIDRAALVSRANEHLFKRKVGAAVAAVRRGGAIHALDTIHHFYQLSHIYSVGSSYWNFAFGRNIGEVASDAEGLQTMRDLGQNMAWLLNKLAV
jgi:multimeric flavodoxin WrbA